MLTPRRLLTLLPLLVLTGEAHAMTVATSLGPPSATRVILSQDAPGDVGSYVVDRGLGTASQVGQTFRLANAADLDRITVRVRPRTDVAGALLILYFGSFGDAESATMDNLLLAEMGALPAQLPVDGVVYLSFDIARQHLEANRQYGFVFGFSGGDHPGEARLDVHHTGADSYAAGQAVEWSGLQSTGLANDLVFYLEAPDGSTDTLSLLGGRFAIEARWRTADGEGVGHPLALNDGSGFFWFFDPANVEIFVKALDACVDPFQRYWVFLAGLTDVAVDVTVRDLLGGVEHQYHNPAGEAFPPILDTGTFATCDVE